MRRSKSEPWGTLVEGGQEAGEEAEKADDKEHLMRQEEEGSKQLTPYSRGKPAAK